MQDLFSLTDEVAVVTGAGSGIGQAIAIGLAASGSSVVLLDLERQMAGLDETFSRIRANGRPVLVETGSVTDPAFLESAIARMEAQLGPLSIAVNAAGIADAAPAEQMTLAQWQRVIEVDLTGIFLSCQAEGRAMLRHGRGSIINIASMSGSIANRGLTQAHYNSAKAAVIHLSKSLAAEWATRGLRVNSISPGYTLTAMNRRPEVAEQLREFANQTPLGRVAMPEEMVAPAVFLAGRGASFITGHDLVVDGGFTVW